MIKTSLLAATMATTNVAAKQESCKALVLGGGGSACAYEVGYLWGLINYDDPVAVDSGKYAYDVITGNSGGSINTLAIVAWPKGSEREMMNWVRKLWHELHTRDVWGFWPKAFPFFDGVFKESGVLDD